MIKHYFNIPVVVKYIQHVIQIYKYDANDENVTDNR